jgi:hypothetical protein
MPHDNNDDKNTSMNPPRTVDEAADEIIETLDLEESVRVSNLQSYDVKTLQMVLGLYTEKQLDKYYFDEKHQNLDDPYGPAHIIERVWEKLRETHKLRVAK